MTGKRSDPEHYVAENKETLVRILKHGDDEFVRALALAAIIRYGNDPLISDVKNELKRAEEER
ncbi:hypothetical protein ACFQH6_03465 [Halobacteriaceae archaeon GCM10025711]